jgi:hypothetical protein
VADAVRRTLCSFVDVHCHLDALPAWCHADTRLSVRLEPRGFDVVVGGVNALH